MAGDPIEEKFRSEIDADLPDDFWDIMMKFIKNNSKPEDVFDDDQLKEWACNNDPEDIFSDYDLTFWAKNNGFLKGDSKVL